MATKISYIEDFQTWEEEFVFFQPVKVRFSETDLFGHLNNCAAFIYLEEARIEFLKSTGIWDNFSGPNSEMLYVTANMQCNYLQQVLFDEELRIYVKANSVGKSSVDLHYLAKNKDGQACLTGQGVLVQISKTSGKGVPWTEEEKRQMKGLNDQNF